MEPYRHIVQYYETDRMGIVHHSNYIRWMEEARVDFLRRIGWPWDELEERGIFSPVLALDCRYQAGTGFGDTITIRVAVREVKGARLVIHYEMENQAGKPVFQGTSEHCFVSRDGRPMRLKRECPEFYALLAELAAATKGSADGEK